MAISVIEARQSIAAEVRAMLARKRITVREAARRLGVNQAWLNRRVNGQIPFDAGELLVVADLLDTPVETFFAGVGTVSTQERIRKTLSSYLRRDLGFLRDSRAVAGGGLTRRLDRWLAAA
jgi:transcriptional regulator with XRE-family HTH domain